MNNPTIMAWSIIVFLTVLAVIKIYLQVRSIKKQQKRFREK